MDRYKLWEANVAADALSCIQINAMIASSLQLDPEVVRVIQQSLTGDKLARKAFQELQQSQQEVWTQHNGLLYWGGKLYVPNVGWVRQSLLQEAHASPSTAHPGIHRTVQQLNGLSTGLPYVQT